MSRIRKSILPINWSVITANFQQGAALDINLANYLSNPHNLTITYSALSTLPSGVTLLGSFITCVL